MALRLTTATTILLALTSIKADCLILVGGNAVQPTALPTAITLSNTSGAASQAAHIQGFATAFLDNAVPSGRGLSATINGSSVSTQLDCLLAYDDGSCRHGKITVAAPLVPISTNYTVNLALAAGGGAPVDLSALPGSGYTLTQHIQTYTYSITGGFVASTAYDIDWMTELTSQLSSCASPTDIWHGYLRRGPVVTECRLNKNIAGSLHVVAHIASYSDGNVSAAIRINNDYAYGGSGGTAFYTYSITQNGSVVVNNSSLDGFGRPKVHFQYAEKPPDYIWKTGQEWTAKGNALTIKADCPYLRQTHAINPLKCDYNQANAHNGDSGDMTLATIQSRIAGSYPAWGGDFPFNGLQVVMGNVGGRQDIGIYTGGSALWLMNGDPANRDFVLGQRDAQGTIPYHIYDTVNGRYLNVSDRTGVWWDPRSAVQPPTQNACNWYPSNVLAPLTNGSTAAGNPVLHFASGDTTGIHPGMNALDNQGGITTFPGVRVASVTTTSVTLDTALTNGISSGAQVTFDCAWSGLDVNGTGHAPDSNYVPYLLTGDRYSLDELQAEAAWVIVAQYPPSRQQNGATFPGGDDALLNFVEVMRVQGWPFGLVAKAAGISPTGWHKTHFTTVQDDSLSYANSKIAILQSLQGADVYGYLNGSGFSGPPNFTPPTPTQALNWVAPWQADHVIQALAVPALNGSTAAVTLLGFLKHHRAQSFLPHAGWDQHDGAMYYMPLTDGSGYHTTWATVATAATQTGNPCSPDCLYVHTGPSSGNLGELAVSAIIVLQYALGDADSLTALNFILGSDLLSIYSDRDPNEQMSLN